MGRLDNDPDLLGAVTLCNLVAMVGSATPTLG